MYLVNCYQLTLTGTPTLMLHLTCLPNSEGEQPHTQPHSKPQRVSVSLEQVHSEPSRPCCSPSPGSNSHPSSRSSSRPSSSSCCSINWRYNTKRLTELLLFATTNRWNFYDESVTSNKCSWSPLISPPGSIRFQSDGVDQQPLPLPSAWHHPGYPSQ